MTYPFGLPIGIGWGVMIALLFAWLIFRFYRHDAANRVTVAQGDGIGIQIGETVGADEPLPGMPNGSGPPNDDELENESGNIPTVKDGEVDNQGERFQVDSVEWIVWLKTPDTATFKVIHTELEHEFTLIKQAGTQRWTAGRDHRLRGTRTVDAGLSEDLNQERLEEIGSQLHGRAAAA